jgi:biotin carboxyl carrier protein
MDDAISFLFDNSSYMIDVVGEGLDYSVYTRGSYRSIRLLNDEGLLHESLKGASALGGSNQLVAGMPGKIVDIFVKPGDEVKAKQSLLIMEAMKMENEMRASHDAKIKEVLVKKGQSIEAGAQLIVFE